MKLDQIRTFLEVAATGNFNRAADILNVTQSTVSARIKGLEEDFGQPLFVRSHAGVDLTAAGRQFQEYALAMQRLWQQAHQAVTLREGYRSTFGLGAQVSLWEHLVLDWISWMRDNAPDVALRVEADYSPSQMQQLQDGLLDIGVMYQPRQTPGLVIEELMTETLVMVATTPRDVSSDWREDYVFVDWGDVFRADHGAFFPEMETPAVSVGLGSLGLQYVLENGGAGYLPLRVVNPLVEEGRLHFVGGAPKSRRPVFAVYQRSPQDQQTQELALQGLRELAGQESR